MSEALNQVIERASTDEAFRSRLQTDPSGALAGYELTPEERAAVLSNPSGIDEMGLDARVTKVDTPAAPGESFAILFPDGESLRVSEVFTSDSCVDNTVRAADPIGEHASIRYSLPSIRSECAPGHVVRLLARVAVPGKPPQYWSVEFPVWYRP